MPLEMWRKMDGMSEGGAYDRRLRDRLHLDSAPSIVTRTLRQAELAVIEIRGDTTQNAVSESIPREDAFLIALQLRASEVAVACGFFHTQLHGGKMRPNGMADRRLPRARRHHSARGAAVGVGGTMRGTPDDRRPPGW